ncbi:MAG: hypothetical protein DYG89_10775 [Caldilinea sp. CFX5]|nr:hypothetical protein [Caldilinea sp. CFX5]
MSVKELVHELEQLDAHELQEVATYIAFLRFRTWQTKPLSGTEGVDLAALYGEFAAEDRAEAEAGMQEYLTLLQAEDGA